MTSPESAFPVDIRHLFRDPDMFDDAASFEDAGFDVMERSSENRIMVGSHRDAKGYLFKKYNSGHSLKDQLENYRLRVSGARALAAFIHERGLRDIVVPQKWLYQLPAKFGGERKGRRIESYVVIAERLKLIDRDKVEREYARIDKHTLKELCQVVFQFRGLDSTPKNLPFTKDGQIAFIDTEGWDRDREPYLKYIRKHLTYDRLEMAAEIFDDLEHEAKRQRKAERRAAR